MSIAISSDMYFGRGSYDPEASNQAQSRLKEFSGATAISSNAYFGRSEEDDEEGGPSGGGGREGGGGGGGHGGAGGDNYLENDTLAGLERGVRDAAGRFMQNPDVQNLTDQIRTGALKVSPSFSTQCERAKLIQRSYPIIWRLTSSDNHPDFLSRFDTTPNFPLFPFPFLADTRL